MLTHDHALLILDHVAEAEQTHTVQNCTGNEEIYRIEMRATVAGLVFKHAGIGFTSYGEALPRSGARLLQGRLRA